MRCLGTLGAIIFPLFAAPAASAVDLETTDTQVQMLKLDLAVPESPAFTALGISPESVERPATPREFATALLTGLDKNGNFQAGLALDVAPYLLLGGDALTIDTYRSNYWIRVLSRSQLSVATTKGTSSNDESVRIGLGYRGILWDRGDPRMDQGLDACLMGDEMGIPVPTDYASRGEWHAAVDERFVEVQAQADTCLIDSEKRLWNATALGIGAAPTWIQEGGTSSDVSWGGATFWGSAAYGFEELGAENWLRRNSQLILHVRYRLDEENPNTAGSFITQDVLLIGGRFRTGKENLSFAAEGSFVRTDPEASSAENGYRVAVNSDLRVYKQTWLNLGLGVNGDAGETRILVYAGLKWGGGGVDLAGLAKTIAPSIHAKTQ